MSFSYVENLSSDAWERYMLKLRVVGLEDCPYRFLADKWTDDPTKWPDVHFGDVHTYHIDTPGVYNNESMKTFKSLEAHRYFRAGFVRQVLHLVTDKGVFVFKTDVMPSQRMNDECHHPWVSTDQTGRVIAAHCTCMAGLGESCSHVAALLFKLEAAVRHGYTSQACTDKPCEWNNFYTEKVTPAPISEIRFYRDEVISRVKETGRSRIPTTSLEPATESEKNDFLQSLFASPDTPVGLSLFKETSHKFKPSRPVMSTPRLPRSLQHMFAEENTKLSSAELNQKCQHMRAGMTVTKEEVDYLDKSTIGQSDNITWHTQRYGRITASFAHKVLHTDHDNPAPYIFKEIVPASRIPEPQVLKDSDPRGYGKTNEGKVFEECRPLVKNFHADGTLDVTGMRVHLDHPWLSASADGIIKCSCHGLGVLEIKSPWTARDKTAHDFISCKDSYMYGGQLKTSSPYYTQVQIQMSVYGASFCAFVVSVKDANLYQQIERNDKFIAESIDTLETIWITHILPELLTRTPSCKKGNCETG